MCNCKNTDWTQQLWNKTSSWRLSFNSYQPLQVTNSKGQQKETTHVTTQYGTQEAQVKMTCMSCTVPLTLWCCHRNWAHHRQSRSHPWLQQKTTFLCKSPARQSRYRSSHHSTSYDKIQTGNVMLVWYACSIRVRCFASLLYSSNQQCNDKASNCLLQIWLLDSFSDVMSAVSSLDQIEWLLLVEAEESSPVPIQVIPFTLTLHVLCFLPIPTLRNKQQRG